MINPQSPRRILVIDDDEGILDAFEAMLDDPKYFVTTALQADILDTLTKDTVPDLLIMDVLLSGTDGRDVCGKLKRNPLTKDMPIVMISAHPKAEAGVKKNGADAYLKKPFEMKDLFEILNKLLP
jgi:DNA-binding response OmpR family regulator